jgi:hypothetical protein
MEPLGDDERAAILARVESFLATARPSFTAACAEYAAIYREHSELLQERLGLDGELAEDLFGLFASYLAYLTAARQVPSSRQLDCATSITSRGHTAAVFTRSGEAFDIDRVDLLSDQQVAAHVSRLLGAGQSKAG